MQIETKTSGVVHAHDNLLNHLDVAFPTLDSDCVIVVTSKIVALCEGAVEPISGSVSKEELVWRESEKYIPSTHSRYHLTLTLKFQTLAVNAGIDESNVKNQYVLLPKDPYESAKNIWEHLTKKFPSRKIGVIISDSKTVPLKWGTVGTSIGYCGFKPVVSKIGDPDIFGRPLQMTKVNVAEGLVAAAVVEMGEAAETTPFACITNAKQVEFVNHPPTKEEKEELLIDFEDDVYYPILSSAPWKKGQS